MAQQKTAADSVPTCNPNAVVTEALARATLSLQRAFQKVQAKQRADSDLKLGIHFLTSIPPKKETGDSLGRLYYLGQAYILLLQEPGVKPIGPRRDYGIATDTMLTIDLLAAADTALTKVAHDWPLCASQMAQWRQQKPWIDALNGSINALNAGKYDSAEALAKRSLIIERGAPYAYSVLASVETNRKEYDSATVLLKHALDLAQKDTIYNDAKFNAMYDLANNATLRAEAATGADKRTRVQEAVAAWQAFIPMGTRDNQVASAEQTIIRLLKSVNDTVGVVQSYAPILANPSKYGEQTLLLAGVTATRAKHPDDAAKMFAAVLEQNPYQRDALNNLAASYVATNEHQKMFPLIDKLVAIDPNNADTWLMYAYAYSGLVKGTKDPKMVKSYTDSLVKYNSKAEKLQTRVSLSEFTHLPDKATLVGTIENKTTTPKSYSLQVDFLDKSGNVVSTQTANVGPVPGKGGSSSFTVTATAPNIVAYRYKPLA